MRSEWKRANSSGLGVTGGKPRDLVFTDYGQAVKLAHWLRHQQKGVTLNKMKFSYPVSKFPNASLVPFKNIKNECDDTNTHGE